MGFIGEDGEMGFEWWKLEMEVGLVVSFCLNGNLTGFEWVLMVARNGENGGLGRLKMSFWGKNGGFFDSVRNMLIPHGGRLD